MTVHQKHYVTFYSPGTFVAEESCKPISNWNIAEALVMRLTATERHGAKPLMRLTGTERHGAKPYGFRFETRTEADPVPDGHGGWLRVTGRADKTSGIHFIDGVVETLETIKQRAKPDEEILLANMECNGWPAIVTTINGFKSIQPLQRDDLVVDSKTGAVIAKGADYYAEKR